MKLVTLLAQVDNDLCTGCRTCSRVCPTLAITMVDRKPKIDPERCVACGNCEQRCEARAIIMIKLEQPRRISVSLDGLSRDELDEMCTRAGFHPSQIVCYCTATRAEEVAAAILKGAHSPEDITYMTGLRGGCSVECIQPALRMLEANNIHATPPKNGYQWYGRTPTLQEIPESIKAKYANHGFCFDDDLKIFDAVVTSERR